MCGWKWTGCGTMFSGDAHVDHPSFNRSTWMIIRGGLKSGSLRSTNWRGMTCKDLRSWDPRPFFGVTAGCMDSINKHVCQQAFAQWGCLRHLRRSSYHDTVQVPNIPVIVYTQIQSKKHSSPTQRFILEVWRQSLRRVAPFILWPLAGTGFGVNHSVG